jgi:hypothetical protein
MHAIAHSNTLEAASIELQELDATSEGSGIGANYAAFLPTTDLEPLIVELERLTAEEFLSNIDEISSRISELEAAAAEAKQLERLRSLRQTFDLLVQPRDIVITFTRPGQSHWHVDVSRSRLHGFVAARWSDTSGNWESGCQVLLQDFRLGRTVYLALNDQSPDHVVAGLGTNSCADHVAALPLRRRSGDVRLNGSTVRYEVMDWPESDATVSNPGNE